MGMIGGGRGAFIGAVHRIAARMDNEIELVCGSFSSNPEKSRETGEDLFLASDRVYTNFEEMIVKEQELEEGERMDFVSVVTPNHMHFAPTKLALESGFPVILDKPMTLDLKEAKELAELVKTTGLPFALTHTYTGYPMIKQARAMVRKGEIGAVRKIYVEYPQGWLAQSLEDTGQKQADWRTDPKRSGISGCMGDIGTHAANLAEYVSGLRITEMNSSLNHVVKGRAIDDDGAILLRFENDATGVLIASQVLTGEENNLRIRLFGDSGGLEWCHEDHNSLVLKKAGAPRQTYRAGVDFEYLEAIAKKALPHTFGSPRGILGGLCQSLSGLQQDASPSIVWGRP